MSSPDPSTTTVGSSDDDDYARSQHMNLQLIFGIDDLGHTGFKDVEKLEYNSKGMSLGKGKTTTIGRNACQPCLAGKMKRSFDRKPTLTRNTKKGRVIHCDTSGRLEVSVQGYHYFLLVVDDAARYIWIRLLKTLQTAEVFPQLEEIMTKIDIDPSDSESSHSRSMHVLTILEYVPTL